MTHLNPKHPQRQQLPNNEDKQRENLFSLLKQAVKSRGYTYNRLAEQMNMSELSIKRLFRDKDCKMSRLLEICSIIGLSVDELVNMQQRFKQTPEFLPEQVEAELASDKMLFVILVLLVSQVDISAIQAQLEMKQAKLYLYLRQLEKLALIELLPDDRYRFTVPLPIRWRMDGHLSDLIKSINQRYLIHCFENEKHQDYSFTTASRLMTRNSAEQIQNSLSRIRAEFDYLSTQDQMFYKAGELELVKLVFAMGPFPVDIILSEE